MKKLLILIAIISALTSCEQKPVGSPVINTEVISETNGCKILKTFEYCPEIYSYCREEQYRLPRPIFSTICNETIKTVTAHEECTQNGKVRSCKDIVDETNTVLKKLYTESLSGSVNQK